MPRTPRRRLETGIYIDAYSLTAKVQVGSGTHALTREKAFDRDHPREEIRRWREETRLELLDELPHAGRGTLAADVPEYLKRCEKRPASYKSKRSELKAWVAELGHLRRHQITAAHIDAALAKWTREGVSLKTQLNRCRTLAHLYRTLANNKRARTPLDTIAKPTPPKKRPVAVPVRTIMRVEQRLRSGDPKTRARYMVMAATGIRPSQLMRIMPKDVNLRRRLVQIEGGKGGEPIVHWLNDDMLAAWQAFVDAKAWGAYDSTKFARELREAGWPNGVRPYNTKHSVGIELAERGAAPADIQAWYGHTDQKTTRIYTGVPVARMRRLAGLLDHRLGWSEIAPRNAPRADGQRRANGGKTGRKSNGRKTA